MANNGLQALTYSIVPVDSPTMPSESSDDINHNDQAYISMIKALVLDDDDVDDSPVEDSPGGATMDAAERGKVAVKPSHATNDGGMDEVSNALEKYFNRSMTDVFDDEDWDYEADSYLTVGVPVPHEAGIPGAFSVAGTSSGDPSESFSDLDSDEFGMVALHDIEEDPVEANQDVESDDVVEAVPVDEQGEAARQLATPVEEPSEEPKSVSAIPWVLLCMVLVLVGVVLVGSVCGAGVCGGNAGPDAATIAPSTYRDVQGLEIKMKIAELMGRQYSDDDSAQKQALHWIIYEDSFQLDASSKNLMQRFALAVFYLQTTVYHPWKVCNRPKEGQAESCYFKGWGTGDEKFGFRWLSEIHECHWAGISCRSKEVTEFIFDRNDIRGRIPSEISMLTQMTSLLLSNNALSGTVPTDIAALVALENLYLGNNDLVGTIPTTIFQAMSNLDILRLEGNMLTGTLPTEVGLFPGTLLGLTSNSLTGTLPLELFNLSNLQSVFVGENKLTGTLPTRVGDLTSLSSFNALGTLLTGTIPSEIGLLKNLHSLDLQDTALDGTLPEDLYTGLDSLLFFRISGCHFTGTVSTKIGRMTSLRRLDIANNGFSGTIPEELSLLTLSQLMVNGNQFTGSLPEAICSSFELGSFFSFVADCMPAMNTGVAAMDCQCCTKCCDKETGFCQPT